VKKRTKRPAQEPEKLLTDLISQLSGMVGRVFLKHGFNPTIRKFDNGPEKIEINEQSHKLTPPRSPAGESSVHNVSKPIVETGQLKAPESFGVPVPPCPICGVIPHNWSIHEEWRHTPGAKSHEKLWADSEAFPVHTCVDQPSLPCPACLKWTGDGFATVKNNPQCFPGIDIPGIAGTGRTKR
jgi:hypothetical protein